MLADGKKYSSNCPVETTLSLIGSKWLVLIIRELMAGTRRFGELHRGVSGVSQKMLTQSLRKMESDGLLSRRIYAEVPPRVEYSLTDLGRSLRPILDALAVWGTAYQDRR
jgi:DNA-binding HxlR family transcriptional regulator